MVSALGLYEYINIEKTWFKINKLKLSLRNLNPAFEGMKIVHLSDLHFGSLITVERFSDVVQMVNRQDPDLILITGDIIDHSTPKPRIPEYIDELAKLTAALGVFAVLGNHDHWLDADLALWMLEQSGIKELNNRVETLSQGEALFHLCGLDDYMVGAQDLDSVLDVLPESGCAVLLVHEPDYADFSAATRRFSLQLSGHSHGGQVDIPLYGPPIIPDYARKYPRGLYDVYGMALYTNTGIGMIPPYVRFNCRPEVAVFILERSPDGETETT